MSNIAFGSCVGHYEYGGVVYFMSNIAFVPVSCVDVYHYEYGGVDLFLFGVDFVFFIGLVGAISLVVVF